MYENDDMMLVPKSTVAAVLAVMDDDCRLDSDGNCQTHVHDCPCSIAMLRRLTDDG